jgi:hypothetical protein
MTPSKRDVENRVKNLEADVNDVQPLTLSHLIDVDDEHRLEPVDENRGVWYSTKTDDLRLGPTKQELEEADDFMDAMTNDDVEVP